MTPLYPHGPSRRQSGQALVVALGLLLAGGVALHLMASAGRVAAAKQRLVDAADAAAWSAAVWRARVLNYHAYANRAILLNEVAVAQAVTLLSWSKYFEQLSRNASEVASVMPPARAVLEGVADAARLAREAAEAAASVETTARTAEGMGYVALLQASQDLLHQSTQGFGASMVAAEVARANDPSFFAWVLPDASDSWGELTRRGETEAERRRFAELVVASLDPFTAGPRSASVALPVPCVGLPGLVKRGATALSDDLRRWEAVDTLSVHVNRPRGFRCRDAEVLPLGWGAAQAGEVRSDVLGVERGVADNPGANRLAGSSMSAVSGWPGIVAVRELAYERLADPLFPVLGLAVLARQPGERVATSMSRGLAAGRMVPPDAFVGEGTPRLWALSAAEVWFRRPPGAPERLEYASLFNPYWQARLAAPTAAQRATAAGYVF